MVHTKTLLLQTLKQKYILLLTAILSTISLACTTTSTNSNTENSIAPNTSIETGSNKVHIVASTPILADIIQNITGDSANVTSFMPLGADPHTFEPTNAQVKDLTSAHIVFYFGLGLEPQLEKILDANKSSIKNSIALGPLLGPEKFDSQETHEEDTVTPIEHEEHEYDPHLWMDIDRMSHALILIADELRKLPDFDTTLLDTKIDNYQNQLSDTDENIQAILEKIPEKNRTIITNHDSLGYFAFRYGFTIAATLLPANDLATEPSARELSHVLALINETGITAIVAETTQPAKIAETLSREAEHPITLVTLYIDSLGEPGSGAETYRTMMETNAMRLAEALKGSN